MRKAIPTLAAAASSQYRPFSEDKLSHKSAYLPPETLEEKNTPRPFTPPQALVDTALNAAAGGSSGVIADLVAFPFSAVKTLQMVKSAGQAEKAGTIETVRKIFESRGPTGFYRGASPVLLTAFPGSALFFTGICLTKQVLGEGPLSDFMAGVVAQILASSVWVPCEQFKELRQMLSLRPELQNKGPLELMRYVIKTEGVSGLYKGFTAQFFTFAPAASLALFFSGVIQRTTPEEQKGVLSLFVANFVGFGAAAGLLTPADVIKTNLQITTADPSRYPDQTILGCAKRLWGEGGAKVFFDGWLSRSLWLATRQGVAFTLFPLFFEKLKEMADGRKGPNPPAKSAIENDHMQREASTDAQSKSAEQNNRLFSACKAEPEEAIHSTYSVTAFA